MSILQCFFFCRYIGFLQRFNNVLKLSFHYQIYLIENGELNEFLDTYDPPVTSSYKFVNTDKLQQNKIVGEIPTKDVIFDETHRKFIDSIAFEILQKNSS